MLSPRPKPAARPLPASAWHRRPDARPTVSQAIYRFRQDRDGASKRGTGRLQVLAGAGVVDSLLPSRERDLGE